MNETRRQLEPNTRLSHYRIIAALGAGAMGDVYLAEDSRLKRKVALKLLPSALTADSERVRRFEQEAQAASALNHPNIITVYDIGESDAGRFIVMEMVTGRTLRSLMDTITPLTTTLALGAQMAKALSAAHAAGITHRDIKPENVMVRDDGYVKVLDFGLARLRSEEKNEVNPAQARLTVPGMLMGTVAYMSPEQAFGEEVGNPSDVFALGVVLYELATGRHPFDATTMLGYMNAITTREPAPAHESRPNLPIAFSDLVSRMLAKDAAVRPAAYEVAQLFDAIERGSDPRRTVAVSRAEKPRRPTQSMAVLPFANISADVENEYFCDGLAEELLNALARIDALKVAARTSAFSFKGKNVEARAIGQALNVDTVLEGSVRKSGNRLRISVQLVSASDGYQLWSERYDRQMSDIFDIQDEITLAVVEALKVTLFGDEKAKVLVRYTDDTDAYEAFLNGRFHAYKYTADGWKRAIEFFQQATTIQPEYAPAYAGLVAARGCLCFFGILPAAETLPQSKIEAAKALAIDPNLAEAWGALAIIFFFFDWNWEEAEQAFARSVELNPNNAETLSYYAIFLGFMGRDEDAERRSREALALDPLSPLINMNVGWQYFAAGAADEATRLADKLIEMEPGFFGAYWLKGAIALSEGDFNIAVKWLTAAVSCGGHHVVLADLAAAHSLAGNRREATCILDQLLSERQHYVPAICLARVYGRLGEHEKAVEWIEKALEERNGELVFLQGEIAFAAEGDALRALGSDPRVLDVLQKINAPHSFTQNPPLEIP